MTEDAEDDRKLDFFLDAPSPKAAKAYAQHEDELRTASEAAAEERKLHLNSMLVEARRQSAMLEKIATHLERLAKR